MYPFVNILDSTNLPVSAEAWTAVDYLELKFLRGFNSKLLADYSLIANRLLLFACLHSMVDRYAIDLSRVGLRINYSNVRHRVQIKERNRNKKTQD